MSDSEKIEGGSKDVLGEHAEFFRDKFPEVLAEGQVDCDKLRQALGEDAVTEGEHYNFTWAGKSGVFDAISRATTATLQPDKEESKDWNNTNNIFIEGENLEVLKILQKSYYGKVKMIYIDPPYNTGKDFVYKDNFRQTKKEEEEAAGNVDEEGNLKRGLVKNTKTGRYHSNWLNMMYPRLFLARNLLKDDGVIFVSIDDNEVHNLRMIMNEIFGEENFVGQVTWHKKRGKDNSAKFFSATHEYLLVYSKNINKFKLNRLELNEETKSAYKNPDNDSRGPYRLLGLWARQQGGSEYEFVTKDEKTFSERSWLVNEESMKQLEEENKIVEKGDNLYRKLFLTENKGSIPETIWLDGSNNANAKDEIKDIFDTAVPFDTPKPTPYLQKIIKTATSKDKNDIILDFFAGSGTTAHAVMAQNAEDGGNRQSISVQLPEETPEDSEAANAGYENIAQIARERIRRAGERTHEGLTHADDVNDLPEREEPFDYGFKAYRLDKSNFKHWQAEELADMEVLQQKLEDAIETKNADAEELAIVYEIMLKLGIELTAEVEEADGFYRVVDTAICLAEDIDEELVESIISQAPSVAVFLESGFASDEQKTNTSLQLKDANIELKVI